MLQAAQANPSLAKLPDVPEDVGEGADPLTLAHSYILESASSKVALPRLNSVTSRASLNSPRSRAGARPRTAPQASSKSNVATPPQRKVRLQQTA